MDQGEDNSDRTLQPAEVFLIISPILAVIIMGLVLVGIMLKRKSEIRELAPEDNKVRYEEFVDIENVTENVELMVQNRDGFS